MTMPWQWHAMLHPQGGLQQDALVFNTNKLTQKSQWKLLNSQVNRSHEWKARYLWLLLVSAWASVRRVGVVKDSNETSCFFKFDCSAFLVKMYGETHLLPLCFNIL